MLAISESTQLRQRWYPFNGYFEIRALGFVGLGASSQDAVSSAC